MIIQFLLLLVHVLFYQSTGQTYDVIIVGGGVAGLKAASDLIANGYSNLLLIEADKRLGGRLNTVKIDNKIIEIGGQWIHGQGANPVYTLMNSLKEVDLTVETFKDERFYYSTPTGQRQDETFVESVSDELHDSYENLANKIESLNIKADYSIGTLMDGEYKKIVNTLKIGASKMKLSNSVYAGMLKDEVVDFATDSFYNVGALGFNDFYDYPGEQHVNLKHGFQALIDYLKKNIADSKIKLNEKVTLIDYSNPTNIVVKTSKQNYNAKKVLVTVSLGYLKSNVNSLFKPALPQNKLTAINRLGYGTVDKFFIEFKDSVFQDNEAGLQILWTEDMKNLDSKYKLNGNKFYQGFNSFYVSPHYDNILYGFLVGEQANYAENLSDNVFSNITWDVVSQAFPYLNLPKPIRIMRSKWNNNPFTKGSYSYFHVGSTGSDVDTLAQPVNKRLFFAGEATARHYTSTVHGAFMSGSKAATQIKSTF